MGSKPRVSVFESWQACQTNYITASLILQERRSNIMTMIDPHDDDFGAICNCAVRYAVGRRTYMPGLVIDFITPHLSELTDKTLWCFQRDLYQRLDEGFDFGDEFDLQNWMSFLEDVDKEVEKRKTEGG